MYPSIRLVWRGGAAPNACSVRVGTCVGTLAALRTARAGEAGAVARRTGESPRQFGQTGDAAPDGEGGDCRDGERGEPSRALGGLGGDRTFEVGLSPSSVLGCSARSGLTGAVVRTGLPAAFARSGLTGALRLPKRVCATGLDGLARASSGTEGVGRSRCSWTGTLAARDAGWNPRSTGIG